MDNMSVAHNVGQDGKFNIKLLGHRVYVRKCVQPDLTDEDGKLIIALCDKSKEMTNWCEVLAVGPECGKSRRGTRRELRAKDLDRWVDCIVTPGDFVVLPECSKRNMMWRGGLGDESELIVDESEMIAMLRRKDA
jgi:co-chaperonin GroES (HSP10)